MRKLIALSILALTLTAESATYYTYTLTVTNTPLGAGDTNIVVGAITRRWTNAYAPTTILTNLANGTNGVATNLFSAFGRYPQSGVTVRQSGVSELTFRTIDLGVSVNGAWASVVTNSTTGTNLWALMLPPENLPAGSRLTNANHLITSIGTDATSNIPQTAKALTNFVSVGQSQDVTNKNLHSVFVKSGTVSNVLLYATGGYVSNVVADTFTVTNGFSSPGTNSTSMQMGSSAVAQGFRSLAVGNQAQATADDATALGNQANATAPSTIALGSGSIAAGTNSVALGAGSEVNFNNSTGVGTGSSPTKANQVMLGRSTDEVRAPGIFSAATSTNGTHTGTNYIQHIPRVGVQTITTLAAGANTLPTITSPLAEITTTAAGFTVAGIPAGASGQMLTLVNLTGQNMTVAHESGSEPTAGNRVLTMTAGDRATTGNGVAVLYYSASQSRWILYILDP